MAFENISLIKLYCCVDLRVIISVFTYTREKTCLKFYNNYFIKIHQVMHQRKNLKRNPPSIKNNPLNIHYVANNIHPQIILKSKNKEALGLNTTSEENDTDAKIKIQDDLDRNQKCDTFVKKRLSVLPTKNIQKQKKDSSITKQDKDLIYENIKSYGSNPKKYQSLGNLIPEEEKQKKGKKKN